MTPRGPSGLRAGEDLSEQVEVPGFGRRRGCGWARVGRRRGGRRLRRGARGLGAVMSAGAKDTASGVSSTRKPRDGAFVETVMVVVSPVGLAVKRAMSSRLSMTSSAAGSGRVAAGSCTTSMSQVWKACSLRRMPTNCSKSRVSGPIEVVKLVRSASVTASRRARRSASAARASSRLAAGPFGVPGVPDAGGEVVGRVLAGEGLVEATLGDDGAGAEVGEDIGDGPLGRVGGLDQLMLAHLGVEPAEPGDGGATGVEVGVSHW